MDIIESVIYRRAYGLASDLAEARSHRLAGRLHDAPGAGGDAAEVLAEVRRRLAVGPEHDGLPVVTGQNRSLRADDSEDPQRNRPFCPCESGPDQGRRPDLV